MKCLWHYLAYGVESWVFCLGWSVSLLRVSAQVLEEALSKGFLDLNDTLAGMWQASSSVVFLGRVDI